MVEMIKAQYSKNLRKNNNNLKRNKLEAPQIKTKKKINKKTKK